MLLVKFIKSFEKWREGGGFGRTFLCEILLGINGPHLLTQAPEIAVICFENPRLSSCLGKKTASTNQQNLRKSYIWGSPKKLRCFDSKIIPWLRILFLTLNTILYTIYNINCSELHEQYKKSCIRERLNLSTCADNITDTIIYIYIYFL